MTPRDPNKKPHRRARKLIVGTDTWWWTYGGRGVILWAPTGARYNVHITALTGRTPGDFERGQWKWTSDGMIFPFQVRAFIDRIAAKNIQPRD